MRTKRFLGVVLTTAIVVGMFIFGNFSEKVKAAQTIDAPVNAVSNITATGNGKVVSFDWAEGDEHKDDDFYIKFSLKQPAYVKFTIVSSVCEENWESLGNINTPNVEDLSGVVVKKLQCDTEKNKKNERYVILEEGTYYVAYHGKNGKESKGTVTTEIRAQYLPRSGNVSASTEEDAIPLKAGEFKSCLITDSCKEQFFVFKLTKPSIVSFDMNVSVASVYEKPCVGYKLYSDDRTDLTSQLKKQKNKEWYIYDGYFLGNKYPSSANTGGLMLGVGTYYLKVFQDQKEAVVKVKANIAPPTSISRLAAPKLKKYKRGTKKITGTAKKDATIKVVVGKKSYTVKANKKGKFTVKLKAKLKKKVKIKISAKLKGYKKSKVVTYRVK